MKPDGTPVTSGSLQFQISVKSPGSEACLLYQETQAIDMTNSDGVFVVGINDGNGTRNDSSGLTFQNVFSNRTTVTLPGGTCASGTTYTPAATDGRKLIIQFNDGTFAGWEALPTQTIGYAPLAIDSLAVGGFPSTSLLRVSDGTNPQTASVMTPGQYASILSIAAGTSPLYLSNSPSTGVGLPTYSSGSPPSSPAAGSIWYDLTNNQVMFFNGSTSSALASSSAVVTRLAVSSSLAANGVSAGTIVGSGTLDLASTGITAGTYTKLAIDVKGRAIASSTLTEADLPTISTSGKVVGSAISSGTIGGSSALNTSGNLITTGTVTGATVTSNNTSTKTVYIYNSAGTRYVDISSPASIGTNYGLVLPNALPGVAGMVLSSDLSGNLSWSNPAAGSVTSVATGTGLTGGTITGIGTIALASSGVTAGSYGSGLMIPWFNVDIYGRITSAGSFAVTGASPVGSSLTSGQMWVGNSSNLAAAVAMSGDATLSSSGSLTLATVPPAKGGTGLTSTGTANQVLASNTSGTGLEYKTIVAGSGVAITAAAGSISISATGSGGTVTNLSTGSGITGGPITGSGTISLSDTAVTPGTYGSATSVAQVTVDQKGRLTGAGTVAIANLDASVITTGTISSDRLPPSVSTWTQTASGSLYYLGGNVGIGTSTPGYALSVVGIDPSSNTIFDMTAPITAPAFGATEITMRGKRVAGVYPGGAGSNTLLMNWTTPNNFGNFAIGSGVAISPDQSKTSAVNALDVGGSVSVGSSYYSIVQAPANGMIVQGNVGIGVAAPSGALHLRAGTASIAPLIISTSAGTLLSSPLSGAIENDGTSLYYTDSTATRRALSSVSGGTVSGGSVYSGVSSIVGSGTMSINGGAGSGAVNFGSGSTVAVQNATASSSSTTGAFVVTGGVGIGGALNVAGAINGSSTMSAATSLTTPIVYGSSAAGGTLTLDSSSNAAKGVVAIAPSGGSIGIGTNSPSATLDITPSGGGSVRLNRSTASANGAISVGGSIRSHSSAAATNFGEFSHDDHDVYIRSSVANSSFRGNIILQPNSSGGGSQGNVGIGTTTPISTLHLAGSRVAPSWTTSGLVFQTQASTLTDSSTVSSGTVALRVANSFGIPTLASANSMTVTNAANLYVAGAPVASGSTTIGASHALHVASGTSYFGGNVGIGVTSPSYKFELNTNDSNGNAFRSISTNGTTTSTLIQTANALSFSRVVTNGAPLVRFTSPDSASTRATLWVESSGGTIQSLWVGADGNVGIGTTAPSASLHLRAGTASNAPLIISTSTGTLLSTPLSGAIENDGTSLYYTDSTATRRALASVSGGTVSGGSVYSGVSSIVGSGTVSISGGTGSGAVNFGSGSTVAVQNSTASSSSSTGALVVTGGVGVGGALNVAGAGSFGGNLSSTGSVSALVVATGTGNGNAPSHTFTSDSTTGVYMAGSGTLAFATAGVERIRIGASGQVGIGTSAPAYRLTVSASNSGTYASASSSTTDPFASTSPVTQIQNRSATDNSFAGLALTTLAANSTTRSSYIAMVDGASGTLNWGSMAFGGRTNNSAYAERMRISIDTGNVGIGITVPLASLHLRAGTASTAPIIINTSTGTLLSTPISGAIEYDGTSLYFTDSTPTRRSFASVSGGTVSGGSVYSGVSSIVGSGTVLINGGTGSGVVNFGSGSTVAVQNATASSSSTTGAFVVTGGVGVGGALNVAGAINGSSTMSAATSLTTPIVYGSSTAGGTLTLDSTLSATKGPIFIAPTGGSISIGKATTPTAPVDVVGASAYQFNFAAAGAGAGTFGQVGADGNGFLRLTGTAGMGIGYGVGSMTEVVRINSSGLAVSALGLSNATAGTNYSSQLLRIQGNYWNGSASAIDSYQIQNVIAPGTMPSTTLQFTRASANTGAIRYSFDGSVGIGTTTPETSQHILSSGTSTTLGQLNTNLRLASNTGTVDAGNEISFRGNALGASNVATYAAISAPITANDATGALGYVSLSTKATQAATGLTERMRITGAGNVGIGTTNPAQRLDVNGTIRATDIILTSDARAKRDIASLDPRISLDKLCQLRPVSFSWKHSGQLDEGLIAQEIRQVFPEFVVENPDGSLSVKYGSMFAPIIASVQELRRHEQLQTQKNQILEKRLESLEAENRQMKEKLESILKRLDTKGGDSVRKSAQ